MITTSGRESQKAQKAYLYNLVRKRDGREAGTTKSREIQLSKGMPSFRK